MFPTKTFTMTFRNRLKLTVSSVSGKLPTSLTPSNGQDWKQIWFEQKVSCQKKLTMPLVNMAYITYNGINYIPQPTTPSDMIREQIMVKREKPLDVLMGEIEAAPG